MYKIAAMGDKDSIYGFASLGLTMFPVDDADTAIHTLRKMVDGCFAVIFITEYLASLIPQEIERYKFRSVPAIIPIPGVKGNTGMGMKSVSQAVEKAVGSDIIK